MYHSLPEYCGKIQQNCFPKILHHGLDVLRETNKQVHDHNVTVYKNTAQKTVSSLFESFFTR